MKLVVVDEADNVVGTKDRDDLKPTDVYRVARLVILNSKGQLLLAQRAFVKEKDPGVWGLGVEGTVEEGEDYESNIRKEAKEEVGITPDLLERGPKLRMTGKYNHQCQFFVYYADLDLAELQLQEDELAAVEWYEPLSLRRQVAENPKNFGYILETVWPILSGERAS